MIEVRNLTKRFGSFCALKELSLTIPSGSVYGLVGPNGAGKSTLLRLLTGVFRPDGGSITIDGQPVYENIAVKARLSFIPDDIFYYNSSNLRDMVRLYAGLYPTFDQSRYARVRKAFVLDDRLPIRRFSKGMQKQAAFLLSICTRPDVLVLDEPVDGLDPVMRRQVWSLILQDVAERGTTVLVSSHNLRELEDVCDHVGILHHGQLLLERSLSELQGNIVKAQVVFREGTDVPAPLDVLHHSSSGKIQTLILRGGQDEINATLNSVSPIFFDLVPLTLEEIFVYELGGADYDVKNILL